MRAANDRLVVELPGDTVPPDAEPTQPRLPECEDDDEKETSHPAEPDGSLPGRRGTTSWARPDAESNTEPTREPHQGIRDYLLIPDCHRPYHDTRAWDLMIRVARDLKPHGIIHLGDYGDYFSISAHDRDPRRRASLAEEFKDQNEGLDELDSLGAVERHFVCGNHDFWLDRLLMRSAPELLGLISVQKELRLQERGWTWTPYRQHRKIGRFYVTHEAGFCGDNAVQRTAAAFQHNVFFGHTHQLAVHYFGDATGTRRVAASLGWLGDISAATYEHESRKKRWQLGFGIARVYGDGLVHLDAVPIVDGRCVWGVAQVAA